jgi:hypothetical protein
MSVIGRLSCGCHFADNDALTPYLILAFKCPFYLSYSLLAEIWRMLRPSSSQSHLPYALTYLTALPFVSHAITRSPADTNP